MSQIKRNVKQQIDRLIQHLEQFNPIVNSHMVEYFTKSLFDSNVPDCIKDEITKIGFKNAIDVILQKKLVETPVLNDYVERSKQFSLYDYESVCLSAESFRDKLIGLGCRDVSSLKLEVFMKPKKSHEVEILSAVSAGLRQLGGTSHVVDIGDGKGYLSSMLAMHHKIPVLGVDLSYVNTTGAVSRVEKLGKIWHSIVKTPKKSVLKLSERKDSTTSLYKQVTQFVSDATNFKQLVDDVFLVKSSGLSLVGLHTCGDLGAVSVRLFANNDDIRTICNVSCCYHLLTEDIETNAGFPMSDHLKGQNFKLGQTARMLSAQSIDRIIHNERLPNKSVFYRAVFETLIEKLPHRNVGRTKRKVDCFVDYARSAFKKLDVEVMVTDRELSNLYDTYVDREDELLVYSLLRCMLSPAIESLILLDRLLYLLERGFENSYLVRFFDPVISPRCYGLVAYKDAK